jgi:lipoteichoic acid synthase
MEKKALFIFSRKKIALYFSRFFHSEYRIIVPILFSFVVANTFKIALFDNVLIESKAPLFAIIQNAGIISKIVLVFFLSFLCLVWKNPFFFICFYSLQTIYMFVNLSYHSHFNGYLHINQYIGLFSEAFDLLKHNAVPRDPFSLLFLIDLPFIIACLIFYRKLSLWSKLVFAKFGIFLLGAVLIYFASMWNPMQGNGSVLDIMNDAYSSDHHVIQKYGLLTFNIMDLLKFNEVKKRIEKFEYGRAIFQNNTDSTHPDFILIQVESLDSYIIGYRHKNKLIMPFLSSISQRCVFFPYALSYHKAGSTSDCEFSIINSIEPFNDYPSIKIRNYDYPNSMLKPLTAKGYDVVAFHGNRGSYFNRTIAFKKMGFSSFYDINSMGLKEKSWGAPDGEVFQFVKTKLATQKSPFFYYIITMSSHEPFNLTQPYFSTNVYDDIKPEIVKNYFIAMTYVDEELKKLVDYVLKYNPNTYIFIYGDHTPGIKKNDYKCASFIDKNKLFEFVPCFILAPNGISHQEKRRAASFLDLAPTILQASKIPFTLKSNGQDLLTLPVDSTLISYNDEQFSRSALFSKIARHF